MSIKEKIQLFVKNSSTTMTAFANLICLSKAALEQRMYQKKFDGCVWYPEELEILKRILNLSYEELLEGESKPYIPKTWAITEIKDCCDRWGINYEKFFEYYTQKTDDELKESLIKRDRRRRKHGDM